MTDLKKNPQGSLGLPAADLVPERNQEPLGPVGPVPLVVATVGHLLVGVLLVLGVQCTPKLPEDPIMQAVLLEEPIVGEKPVTVEEAVKPKPPEPKPPPPKPEPPKPKPPEPTPPPPPKPEPPKPDPEKVKAEAEAAEKKRIEDVIKKQEEILLAQQKAEQQRQAAEEKAKADAEKARVEAEAKAKKEAEEAARKAAEEAARKAALEAEQKRLQEIEDAKRREAEAAENKRRAEEKARQEALARQLAAEEAARMAAIRADAQKLWGKALEEAIRRNWLRPPDNQTDFRCAVSIRLTPTGQVVSARITSSCGSMVLDDSVIKAVYKASPLPLPSEPTAFVPDLTIRFRP